MKFEISSQTTFQMLAVLCCCLCQLYVYSVAHSHTKNISKTLQSHHASMQRLNSICGVKPGLPQPPGGVKRDTLMVYNEVEAGIDTCLLYSGRPQGPVGASSATSLAPHPPHPPQPPQPAEPPATPRPPQRTCYLLLTPVALLSAWTPNITARILASSDSAQSPHLSLAAQLSVNLPLLILGCLNPWLYHKLSLGRCDGENCLSQQLDLTQSYTSHLT